MANASHYGSSYGSRAMADPVRELRDAGLPARLLAVVGGVHPTSAQRWIKGSEPRGPALRRLRRAARIARSWPAGAMPPRRWIDAPAAILSDHSPAAWIGADGEDLPLAEAWREATEASAAALGRAFPELAERDRQAAPRRNGALLIVERAARDLERSGIRHLLEAMRSVELAVPDLNSTSRWVGDLERSGAAGAFASLADTSALACVDRVADMMAPMQSPAWSGFADLVAASGAERLATLGLLDGTRPYARLGELTASSAVTQAVAGLDLASLAATAEKFGAVMQSWADVPFASLAVAVDTSLVGAVGFALDADHALVEPFGREAAAWAGWLPQHPQALELSTDADPAWTAAAAHVLTRTVVAASGGRGSTRSDDRQVNEAIDAGRRLRFDLELPLPGTPYRLREVLGRRVPQALEAFDGAIAALAARSPDAARHVGVSLREGVKAISYAIAPHLAPNASAAERWKAAVGIATNDPQHGKLLMAQLDVLTAIGSTTSAAVHGSPTDLNVLEVAWKAATAALCSVLASWFVAQGVTL